MTEVTCEVAGRDILGECPLWNQQELSIYWVDIERKRLQRFQPATGESRSWSFPERIGAFCFRKRGGLVVALESGIYLSEGESTQPLAALEAGAGVRFNDGRCDSRGRFWTGTMDLNARERKGALYCLDERRTCHRVIGPAGIPNGLAWRPDGRVFYYTDSLERLIYACDCDPTSGTVWNRRVFVDLTAQPGVPDGAAVDEEGFLWSAQCNGWRLRRYAPDGTVDRIIELPVQYPTSCCFGGPELRTLYVTSAVWDLNAEAVAAQPLAGCLLSIDVGVKGIAENWFEG